MSHPLKLEDIYYEDIRREFVDGLLMCGEEGDFIARRSGQGDMVISVFWQGAVRHFLPIFKNGQYGFGHRSFPTFIELVNHHYLKKIPLSGGDSTNAVLKRAKIKEKTTYDISDIDVQAKLGEGNFGEVFKVLIKSSKRPAAMKTLRATVPKAVRETFMKEFNMMNTMKHENVVGCIGVVEDGNKSNMKILLELINKGSLDKLLRESKLTVRGKSRILIDVARGMQYLHQKNIIHRDLAARNILVQRNLDGTIVGKVSDFGLSQMDEQGQGYCLKSAEQLPLKWLAPECLRIKKWTSASDVWSFGILMWEVWTNGNDPYSENPAITDAKVLKKFICDGGHPKMPEYVPAEFITVMLSCWVVDLNKRATMDTVLEQLEKIHQNIRNETTTAKLPTTKRASPPTTKRASPPPTKRANLPKTKRANLPTTKRTNTMPRG